MNDHRPDKRSLTPQTIIRKIGGTTYVVSGVCSPAARETAEDKMRRLILSSQDKRREA